MKRPIFIAILLAAQGCSKKEHLVEKEARVRPKDPVVQTRNSVEPENLLQTAKTKFPKVTFHNGDTFKKYAADIADYAEKIAKSENITHGQALNNLYLALTEHAQEPNKSRFKSVFGQGFLDDPRGLPTAMSDLPAGELRRVCLGWLRGKNLGVESLAEVYHAMPESSDRSRVADMLVSRTYSDRGVDSALQTIQSLATQPEKEKALSALAGQMSAFFGTPHGHQISDADLAKVMAYAKAAGQETSVWTLKSIKPENH